MLSVHKAACWLLYENQMKIVCLYIVVRSPFLCCPGKWSGLNRISHPHWVKICDDHNGQINLRAKQKYEVLSATNLSEYITINTERPKCKQMNSYLVCDRFDWGNKTEFGTRERRRNNLAR